MINKQSIVNEAKIVAIQALKNFFKLLDLDPELFHHLYEIPMTFGKNPLNAPASYDTDKNLIILDNGYLDDMIDTIMEDPKDEKTREMVITNISVSIIHEIIHATRAIFIEDGINAITIDDVVNTRFENYQHQKQGHDINIYRNLLLKTLKMPFVKKLKQYIPIKVRMNNDGTYTVIAYDIVNDYYIEFKNQKFEVKFQNGLNNFYYQIGLELINKEKEHQPTTIIPATYNETNEPRIVTADEYYHPYSNMSHTFDKDHLPSLGKVMLDNNKLHNKAMERVGKTRHMEESIVETLANIIIRSRNDSKLDLDKVTKKIVKSHSSYPDERIMAIFIRKMGVDMVKWFLLSSYGEYYDDKLERLFQEKYDSLLNSFSNIYEDAMDEIDISEEDVLNIDNIVEEKIGRKK